MAKKSVKKTTPKKSPAKKFTIFEIIRKLEQRVPTNTAESWDQVGLLAGKPAQKFTGAVVGVDLTLELLNFAKEKKANLVVTHHPAIFPKGKGLQRLVAGRADDLATLLLDAYESGICVYAAHTNFDICALDGMLDLADQLGIKPVGRLMGHPEDGQTVLKKLVTFVPKKSLDDVRDALFEIGAGQIGNYDCCGFSSDGEGSFRGLEGTNPVVGKPGVLENTKEVRFETVFPAGLQPQIVAALKDAHPYEEVAYDIYPVEQHPTSVGLVAGLGYGIYGDLEKPMDREDFIQIVKEVFQVDLFLTNAFEKKVKRVAFSPGKGSSFISSARSVGADVFVTGEVGYHGSLDSTRREMMVFELGHRESEHFFLRTIYAWFQEWNLKIFPLDERTQQVV